MFTVKWRKQRTLRVVQGISRYATRLAAERQVAIWSRLFPANTYYIKETKS